MRTHGRVDVGGMGSCKVIGRAEANKKLGSLRKAVVITGCRALEKVKLDGTGSDEREIVFQQLFILL